MFGTAVCHNEQSGFAEDWLHLGRVQARWATPKPLRLGHAQARGWLGMALDLVGALALHSVCTVFASLLWCYRKQAAPRPNSNRAGLVRLSVCTVFRVSNSVTNPERRIKRSLNYAEAKPALAAEQQQYAPSFSLSAPCILLTLPRRLRVISNAYFDTPSCMGKDSANRAPIQTKFELGRGAACLRGRSP